jgi:hypothetical protein
MNTYKRIQKTFHNILMDIKMDDYDNKWTSHSSQVTQ